MKKEMTPLQALTRIKQAQYFVDFELDAKVSEDYKKELDIIKTALKDYELMKQTKIIVADKKISDDDLEKLKNQRVFVSNLEQCEIKPLLDEETKKKLKAFEIIKKHSLNVGNFITAIQKGYKYETYNKYWKCWKYSPFDHGTDNSEKKLSRKNFDLLKEAFL